MLTLNVFRVAFLLSVSIGITLSAGFYDSGFAQEQKMGGFTSACAGNFVATKVDTNGDGLPGSIATLDCTSGQNSGGYSLAIYFELYKSDPQPTKPCKVDDKTTGTQYELVPNQGNSIATRIRKSKEGKPQTPDQIYGTIAKITHCVDLTSGRFSNVGEGEIVGGTGRFAELTGMLVFDTVGHYNSEPPLFWGAISSNNNTVTFSPKGE